MNLTQQEWHLLEPLRNIYVECIEDKILLKTPEGLKELHLVEAWHNFVDTRNRVCNVLKVPEFLGSYKSYGNTIAIPKECVEVGDIVIPEHLAIVSALNLTNEVTKASHVQVEDRKFLAIHPSEISAIIKNGVLWGMPQFFIGKQVIAEKNALLQLPERKTNKVVVVALPYGYDGEVNIGDVIIFDNKGNKGNALYHIESEMHKTLPDDYVRVFVDLVDAVERKAE